MASGLAEGRGQAASATAGHVEAQGGHALLYTIGHSTLSRSDFLAMLGGQVSTIIDIRSHPTSKWEWFWKASMEDWLPEAGVDYEWWPSLGGWDRRHEFLASEFEPHGVDLRVYAKGKFPKQRIAINKEPDARQEFLPAIQPSWTNVGLRDYSFFMTLPEFIDGCDRLIERGRSENIGFMCCEALHFRCHRSMISDFLTFRGVESYHVMAHFRQKNKVKFVDGYKLVPHSKVIGNRLSRYEPSVIEKWQLPNL